MIYKMLGNSGKTKNDWYILGFTSNPKEYIEEMEKTGWKKKWLKALKITPKDNIYSQDETSIIL